MFDLHLYKSTVARKNKITFENMTSIFVATLLSQIVTPCEAANQNLWRPQGQRTVNEIEGKTKKGKLTLEMSHLFF